MKISNSMLDLLIDHIDGPVPMVFKSETIGDRVDNSQRRRAIISAVQSRFLVYVDHGMPTKTALTPLGRERMCEALADMAEMLLRAKFSPDFRPPPGLAIPSVSPDSASFCPAPDKSGDF